MFCIKDSGLYDALTEIRFSVLGITDLVFDDPKGKIVAKTDNIKLYETFTLQKLWEDSFKDNFNVLYIHTKGVSRPKNIIVKKWLDYLCYFNVYQWKECVKLLKNHDTAGVDLVKKKDWCPCHYSGNIWWSTSSYIHSIKKPVHVHYHSPEFWLTEDEIGKYGSLFISERLTISSYVSEWHKEMYVDKPLKPYTFDFVNHTTTE